MREDGREGEWEMKKEREREGEKRIVSPKSDRQLL